MITPQEIQEKVFDKAVRGYNSDQVDVFLDELTTTLEDVLSEKARLAEELAAANAKLDEYKAQEGAVIRTLESAKGLMNEISASAEKRADIIMKNAQLSADQLLRSAQENVDRLKDEEKDLGYRVASIKNRFKNILQAELDRFDNMSQDIFGAFPAVSEETAEDAAASHEKEMTQVISIEK